MNIFLSLLIIVCAIGLVLKYRAFIRKQEMMVVYPYRRFACFSNCLMNLFWFVFLVGLFIIVFGYGLVKTYYDDLLLNLLLTTAMMVFAVVVFLGSLAELISPVHVDFFDSRIKGIFFLGAWSFILFFGVLLVFSYILPDMPNVIKGLQSGPQLTISHIQGKHTDYSRAGTVYYVTINGESRRLKDSQWWHSFETGDEISFLENPYSQITSPIFQPDQSSFTLTGILIIVLALSFWVLMIWLAWEGYVERFGNGRFLPD